MCRRVLVCIQCNHPHRIVICGLDFSQDAQPAHVRPREPATRDQPAQVRPLVCASHLSNFSPGAAR